MDNYPAPVMERCEICRSICLCRDECTCMTYTVIATNECGCKSPDPSLAHSECEHLLCLSCTDSPKWDGAPTNPGDVTGWDGFCSSH